ncbi:iron-sulfur cluster repair di-iron protein [Flammeovirgaceae bacterium 311]|nr:iron-sulfur cluster repair di-iron protein [Flammeovirgaceae bacterium 311]
MATAETLDFLDVTKIEPRLKHPTIFKKFDSLRGGQAFVIHNDHDPKPLYYQLLGERGPIFNWVYLEEGPEVWEVRITKIGSEASPTIGELVAKDYRRAQVFKKWGIDFCCGGKKNLAKVCAEKGIDQHKLEQELNTLPDTSSSKGLNYDSWELDFLADFIENTHHSFVRHALPAINEYTTKIARVHGGRHPELLEIATTFAGIAAELEDHMRKEEQILFPYIRTLSKAKRGMETIQPSPFGTVANPIRIMETEHESAGEGLEKIRTITGNYTLPADA